MSNTTLPLPLYRASQVRELDRITIEEMGIPSACLMQRAGSAAFAVLQTLWPDQNRVIVLCGMGNNAGDGYVLARLAYLAGYEVNVLQLGDTARLKGDALNMYQAMNDVGLQIQVFSEKKLGINGVVVDALLGTGLDREVSGEWKQAIEAANRSHNPTLAIDIPSGLHADTGKIMGAAIHAEATVSFIGLKQGLFTGEGPEHTGHVYFDDLKAPTVIYRQVKSRVTRLDYELLKTALPRRSRTAHKGSFGTVLVVGGDHGMTGAIRLAAEAAARIGAGKVMMATRKAHAALLNLTCPELMSHGVETPEEVANLMNEADVIAVGPGLGQSVWSRALLDVIKDSHKSLVVDADALNLMAQRPFRIISGVMTPHPGEAARLLDTSVKDVQADRFAAVQSLQLRYGGVCILKGAGSLVADESGIVGVCMAGNPGMATGGMGDVLTGVVAGLLAQGLSSVQAANLAVCLHGKAGDKAADAGERGLLPSDLLPWLRYYANPYLAESQGESNAVFIPKT